MADLPDISEGVAKKARTYLTEGKIQVVSMLGDFATFTAAGSGKEPYEVICNSGIWSCSCPAHVVFCAHVIACRLICGIEPTGDITQFGTGDDSLASIFDDLHASLEPSDNDWTH